MKTATKKKTQKWPMIRVDYCDPSKPDEIITLEGAATRFKLDERDVNSLREGHILGTSVNTSPEARSVNMIHRYTREDSIRDASEDLLKALVGMVECAPCKNGCEKGDPTCATRVAEAAIKKAERTS